MSLKTTLMGTALATVFAVPALADGHISGTTITVDCSAETLSAEAMALCEAEGVMTAGMSTEAEAEMDAEAEAEVEEAAAEVEAATEAAAAEVEEAAEEVAADVEAAAEGVMRDLADYTAFNGLTVSELVGMDVHTSPEDEDVGEIDYIFQNADGYHAVIGVGGFLGLGEHTVAVPLGAFTMGEDNTLYLDGYTEEELETLPEIDETGLEALPGDHVIA